MTPKELVEAHINLKSYSSSEGWVGFFEKSGSHNPDLCIQAVNEFLGYFSDDLKNAKFIFSLSFWSSVEDLIKDYEVGDLGVGIINKLLDLDWFKSEMEPNKDFIMVDCDSYERSNIYHLLLSIMVVGDIIGSVFIILPKKSLVLYPHEDIGFGVISTGASDKEAVNFLKHMSRNSEFSSYKGLWCEENKM